MSSSPALLNQYYVSLMEIKADEDKTYVGGFVAAPNDPWGASVSAAGECEIAAGKQPSRIDLQRIDVAVHAVEGEADPTGAVPLGDVIGRRRARRGELAAGIGVFEIALDGEHAAVEPRAHRRPVRRRELRLIPTGDAVDGNEGGPCREQRLVLRIGRELDVLPGEKLPLRRACHDHGGVAGGGDARRYARCHGQPSGANAEASTGLPDAILKLRKAFVDAWSQVGRSLSPEDVIRTSEIAGSLEPAYVLVPPATTRDTTEEAAPPSATTRRVLVVDDDSLATRELEGSIGQLGVEVRTSHSIEDALQVAGLEARSDVSPAAAEAFLVAERQRLIPIIEAAGMQRQ